MTVQIIDRRHELRALAEEHVRGVYRRSFGAVVRQFPDLLAVLVGADGAPSCVAGVRYGLADCFSEQYLDRPVEEMLGRFSVRPVARDEILEVTTLAGEIPHESFRLVRDVIDLGRRRGMRWGVFTATRKLRQALPRLDLPLVELAPARRERVASPADWGTYYETDPWVCAIADRTESIGAQARREAV